MVYLGDPSNNQHTHSLLSFDDEDDDSDGGGGGGGVMGTHQTTKT